MRIQKGELRVNDRIRVREVRLVSADGAQAGVVPVEEALKAAREANLDLVEVAPLASPPVCRVMDYAKYRYEQARQERESRQHQRHSHLKELRFRPQIDEHDYQTKLRSLVKFLKRGDKVKVTLVFRGREMAHQEFGHRLVQRLQTDIADVAQVERAPMQEGRFVFLTVAPK
ncbi:MAG: translation initiation factor IF-3 [Candidatus Omnitrophica bacterium]|nr:translation initiation factor IF-3 [Candidatus Omnitrophota bacterium]